MEMCVEVVCWDEIGGEVELWVGLASNVGGEAGQLLHVESMLYVVRSVL